VHFASVLEMLRVKKYHTRQFVGLF